ncbi:MAG: hypothetical protein KDB27_21900 [Planctomycetales bacterium]|nr:hypothetical protein [Planctomycetales bacterium]
MRRSNVLRAATSLIVVAVLFGIYSLTIVPAIEPSFVRSAVKASATTGTERSIGLAGEFGEQIVSLFAPDAWEAQSPRVLRDDDRRTAILFQRYQLIDGGGLHISPCTVVYGTASVDENGKPKPPLVMSADGATIHFDEPINLSNIKLGRPQSGQLLGPVLIQRSEDSAGRGRLVVDTSNVHISPNGIMTPSDFKFEYEKNTGSGSNLIIKIESLPDGKKATFDVLQSIELVELDQLYLNPETADPLGSAESDGKDDVPTTVTCKGPCRIDLRRQTLSFAKDVFVQRVNNNGSPDALACDLLTIFFEKIAQPPSATKAKPNDRMTPDFKVQRLLATGAPVRLDVPSRFAHLRGSRLEYNLLTREFRMTSADQSSFRHANEDAVHRLVAPQVTYRASKGEKIGDIMATGPGAFHANLVKAQQAISVGWKNLLSLRPDAKALSPDDQPREFKLLSADGDVEAKLDTTGTVLAGHVNIWLEPTDDETDDVNPATRDRLRVSLQPHHLEATRQVAFESPKLAAKCQYLSTRFHQKQQFVQNATQVRPANFGQIKTSPAGRARFTSDTGSQRAPAPNDGQTNRSPAKLAERKVQVNGTTIAIKVTMDGQDIQAIDQVDVKGNARFRELANRDSTTQPISVDAQAFRLSNPDSLKAFVQAIGEPTVISTGGFKFTASNVQLDREKNLVWSTAKGEAKIPIEQDFNGLPLQEPREATVTWDRSMEFDGSIVKLTGNAFVDGPDFQMRARQLQVHLDRYVDFSEKSPAQPDIKELTAQDDVRAVYETYEFGKRMTSTFFQVPNISVNALNGDLSVDGAGQILLTKRGFKKNGSLADEESPRNLTPQEESTDELLTFLQIDFQSDVRGNVKKRHLEFHRHVKAIYGPVYDWDQKINPNADPQEDDILMSCDTLIVAQGRARQDGTRPMDMRAIGNTFVEGMLFQAAGDQVAYDQSKDLLTLKGDGVRHAEIRYRDAKGAKVENSAKEFKFYPGERRAEFNEVPVLEFRTIGK